jgi:hypothetical protein
MRLQRRFLGVIALCVLLRSAPAKADHRGGGPSSIGRKAGTITMAGTATFIISIAVPAQKVNASRYREPDYRAVLKPSAFSTGRDRV